MAIICVYDIFLYGLKILNICLLLWIWRVLGRQKWTHNWAMAAQPGADNIPSFKVRALYLILSVFLCRTDFCFWQLDT